jgi:hypothetical protein
MTAKPTRQTRIAGHVFTAPVVQEVPIRPPAGCWDATW